ncbi:MAG: AbrB/MazE/SpoVT family DNA-binding domain-containing protein [Gemmatimonadetes bacterium]|nr:AbrB/MazE/SpoVT family DNA-binding domain-containing protein [Gemmatimonadota bacterium]
MTTVRAYHHCRYSTESGMRASVQKWGNSLAIRIPKALADDARLGQGTEVEVTADRGRLVVAPIRQRRYTLRGLLGTVTAKNRHRHIEWGKTKGGEAW